MTAHRGARWEQPSESLACPRENIVDDEITFDALLPRIPDGFYDAVVFSAKKVLVFQTRWVVMFTFRIVEQGPYFDVELPGYANIGSDRKNSVKARSCSKLASWCRLIAKKKGVRTDRLSLKTFQDFYFKVEVSTVRRNSRQRDLNERDQYSVVSDIKEIIGSLKSDR